MRSRVALLAAAAVLAACSPHGADDLERAKLRDLRADPAVADAPGDGPDVERQWSGASGQNDAFVALYYAVPAATDPQAALRDALTRLRARGAAGDPVRCSPEGDPAPAVHMRKPVRSNYPGVKSWDGQLDVFVAVASSPSVGRVRAPYVEVRLTVGRGRAPGARAPASTPPRDC